MNRAAGLCVLLAVGCGLGPGCEPPQALPRGGPPNLILILSDDHAFDDYGFMGSKIARTPHIDELAAGGSVFPLTYNTASICRPSQLSLLTGLDPLQWGAMQGFFDAQTKKSRETDRVSRFTTLPRTLGFNDYKSLQAGKLWEGTFEAAGFDAGQKIESKAGIRELSAWSGGPESHAIGRTTMAPVHEFIDAHLNEPFFVWFAPLLPHVPFDAPARYTDHYEASGLPEDARGYYANIERLDDVIGELVDHLERRGIRDNTLIVFLADNGWEVEEDESRAPGTWAGGVRGKASMYELGWRTPLIFNWPGTIPAGAQHATLASSLDVFQTLLDYGGMRPLRDRPGLSLRTVIEGGDPAIRDALIGSDAGFRPRARTAAGEELGQRAPAYYVRDEAWHYIWNSETQEQELFAIADDPRERNNLVSTNPALARAYRARIDAWIRQARRPVNPSPRVIRAPVKP